MNIKLNKTPFIFFLILFFYFLTYFKVLNANEQIDGSDIIIGEENAIVEIIIYESLTCSHCAEFHKIVLPKIKKQYVDTGKVKLILKDFPLDLASLNAAKIVKCADKKDKLSLLNYMYENQSSWSNANDISQINENLSIIAAKFNLNKDQANECIENKKNENIILNNRIDANKKYKINSTPSIVINKKKLKGPSNFENIKKALKKII